MSNLALAIYWVARQHWVHENYTPKIHAAWSAWMGHQIDMHRRLS